MSNAPLQLTVETHPQARFDTIDVNGSVHERYGRVLDAFQRVLYCSHHTTAGFLDQRLASLLQNRPEGFTPFIRNFQQFFPEDAGYRHDKMHLRDELTDEEKTVEPPNADAHLTFIGAGMKSCVTYRHQPDTPVFLMDLDGVYEGRQRTRRTSLIAYNDEHHVDRWTFEVPVSHHAIDSINLADNEVGLIGQIEQTLRRCGVEQGRVDIRLENDEAASALTVNEFETLLMRHDLAEVLQNPMKFMAHQGRRMLRDPRAVPAKSIGYAKYDFVRLLNKVIDSFGLKDSTLEAFVSRLMAYPARRLLHWKRSISLPVSTDDNGVPRLIKGQYQTPILIQWSAAARQARTVEVSLTRFA